MVYVDPLESTAPPFIVKSIDGRASFSTLLELGLASGVSCDLFPMTGRVASAACPTGMMESWWHTTHGGQDFKQWWETSGTGGDTFDPLSATVVMLAVSWRRLGAARRSWPGMRRRSRAYLAAGPVELLGGRRRGVVFLVRELRVGMEVSE
jgi:hypothetical protein